MRTVIRQRIVRAIALAIAIQQLNQKKDEVDVEFVIPLE
jgi:hypothetical protein